MDKKSSRDGWLQSVFEQQIDPDANQQQPGEIWL